MTFIILRRKPLWTSSCISEPVSSLSPMFWTSTLCSSASIWLGPTGKLQVETEYWFLGGPEFGTSSGCFKFIIRTKGLHPQFLVFREALTSKKLSYLCKVYAWGEKNCEVSWRGSLLGFESYCTQTKLDQNGGYLSNFRRSQNWLEH